MSELNSLQQAINKRAEQALDKDIQQKLSMVGMFIGHSEVYEFEVNPINIVQPNEGSNVLIRLQGGTIIDVLCRTTKKKKLQTYIDIATKEHFKEVEQLKEQVAFLTNRLDEVTGLLNV